MIPIKHKYSVYKLYAAIPKCLVCFLTALVILISTAKAFEHEGSSVNFHDYSRDVIRKNREKNKPYFLLFAAQWCHWCDVFNEETLSRKKVYSYLRDHFTNIFIDADIHSSAYRKYKATGVPFTVFLNPDGSIYYKYAGALYEDEFLEVIQDVHKNISENRSVDGEENFQIEYTPPAELKTADLDKLREMFHQGILDNFDLKEYGLGTGEKSVLHQTFLYLLDSLRGTDRKDAIRWITRTLEKAVEHIYDPVEGGFFRYAEKKDWQIPHYEKMADLNAGAVMIMYEINGQSPSPELKKAADKTVQYLTSTLFDTNIGSFLSFQEADTSYYFLSGDHRKNGQRPNVVEKVFTDRLAKTLFYLIDVLDYTKLNSLEEKVTQSLDFMAEMILKNDQLYHYYSISERQWLSNGSLPDHAYSATLFLKAATKFVSKRYHEVAMKILRLSKTRFHDTDKQIFFDPSMDSLDDVEYLMEMNGLFSQMMLDMEMIQWTNDDHRNQIEPMITYFSAMDELLEEQIWDAENWQFAERYVPYMRALDKYLASSE
ncbi:DUF255 domain-containing protein [Deltaproteobacteria bacterium]|nr:DUF255 domain-containing protein [Deltaproteobacteria bacterium]